jgi:Domain of unknown function (DUF4386)
MSKPSNAKTARIAGSLYLAFIGFTLLAEVVRSRLIVFGDATATANNIMASQWLFRAGFVSELLSALFFLSAAWALYAVLKSVNNNLALLFLLLNLCGVAVESLNMLNQFAALQILSGATYLNVFQGGQLQALAMSSLYSYTDGFMIAQIFYGAWLLPLGYLVYRSGLLPRILGVLLIIDFFGVLIWFFQFFLLPGYAWVSYPGLAASFVAEFSLAVWLLIKGVRDRQPTLIEAFS